LELNGSLGDKIENTKQGIDILLGILKVSLDVCCFFDVLLSVLVKKAESLPCGTKIQPK